MSNATVIYHSADFDGLFCREIAWKFLPEGTRFIGWNYGEPKIPMPATGTVYILDLSPDCLVEVPGSGFVPHEDCPEQLVWIDHHKTAIDKFSPSIPGYRIDGVAACRLAWQWFARRKELFHPTAGAFAVPMPDKQAYVDRRVAEPLAVRLAGEYDVWDKRDPNAETFQFGLRSRSLTRHDWKALLDVGFESLVEVLLDHGAILQNYQRKQDEDLVKNRSYHLEWEGLDFLVLNTGRFNSLTFAALDKPETGHDALLGYMFNGKHWTVSLYHAKHRTDLDLSEIAKKHGGGGHRGACGFTCSKLPWV